MSIDFYSLQSYYSQLEHQYIQLMKSNDWLDPKSTSYKEASQLNSEIQNTIEQMMNSLKQLKDKHLTKMYSTLLKKYIHLNQLQQHYSSNGDYEYNVTISNMYYYHSIFWFILSFILLFFILNILFN